MELNESVAMTFPNKLDYSFMVQLFVREIAKKIGFSGEDLNQIDIAVEESVSNIMLHANDEENATFDIICKKVPRGMEIVMKEKGIPFDPEQLKKYELTKILDTFSTKGLGIYLIQKVMDELSFRNLGTEGKETVMVKYLPDAQQQLPAPKEQRLPKVPEVIKETIEYEVRGLKDNEAIEVSRCAYKTHGYTFFDDHIYYPDRLVEMNRNSELISAVAVTKDHVFMGHAALLFQYTEDTITELTFVFVNLEFRGQGALNRLVDYLFKVPKKRELRGIYAYAVTNHVFTQKSMIRFQINDCGILLATSPASWKFKGISDASQRISVVLSFRYMIPPLRYQIYPPEHHKTMVGKLYENLGAEHDMLVPPSGELQFQRSDTLLRTGINLLEGCAEIYLAEYGDDCLQAIKRTLREYCVQQLSAINLFLSLRNPLTYIMTSEFEKMGFFFAGILPESRIGDALILQYLNNVNLDYGKIQLLTDLSKELMDYIRERDPNVIV